jgi:predicted dithiol-disulfide oxidoreductase (DUF899 family)
MALTRARDALAAARRRMPWLTVYVFEGPAGKASLLDLFDSRRQLIAVASIAGRREFLARPHPRAGHAAGITTSGACSPLATPDSVHRQCPRHRDTV